jgi:hypothetical protein
LCNPNTCLFRTEKDSHKEIQLRQVGSGHTGFIVLFISLFTREFSPIFSRVCVTWSLIYMYALAVITRCNRLQKWQQLLCLYMIYNMCIFYVYFMQISRLTPGYVRSISSMPNIYCFMCIYHIYSAIKLITTI